MESKKSPQANLENKRGLFLQIGLIVSLLACIAALGWNQREKTVIVLNEPPLPPEPELTQVTYQDQKPATPRIIPGIEFIRIVENTARIVTPPLDAGFDPDEPLIVKPAAIAEQPVEEDDVFISVENMPTFEGSDDLKTFSRWVQQRLKYPVTAQENNIQGTVVVTFVIGKDGSLSRVEILNSPDRSLAEEAVRVIRSSPRWQAGKQRGLPAQVRFNLPVVFRIQ